MTRFIPPGSGRVTLSIVVILLLSVIFPSSALGDGEVQRIRHKAEQGDAEAQAELGQIYAWGGNDVEAFKWLRWAAEQGFVLAQYDLSYMYEWGHGVQKDYVEAHKWYDLAISELSQDDYRLSLAREQRDRLAKRMTREEVATAQRLAIEWQPKTWNQLKAE